MHFLIYHRGVRVTGQMWSTTHNKSPGGLYQLPFRKWIQWPTVMWISFAHDFAGRQPCVYVRANCRFWNWIQVWKQCQNGHGTMEWHGVTRHSRVTGVRKSRGNRVFFHGDLYVHVRELLTLHRSNPTRSFRQLPGRRFFTLSKTSTGFCNQLLKCTKKMERGREVGFLYTCSVQSGLLFWCFLSTQTPTMNEWIFPGQLHTSDAVTRASKMQIYSLRLTVTPCKISFCASLCSFLCFVFFLPIMPSRSNTEWGKLQRYDTTRKKMPL